MATNGKLEAQLTVPTGGWVATLTDALGGPTAVTLPAGTYYHSSVGSLTEDLAAAFATAANAVMGQTWTCTIAAGESGTGKYTIGCDGATCTITWTDVELRNLLGFTGDKSGSTSYTSTDQAEGLWIASYPFQTLNGGGAWKGWWETNGEFVENSNGNCCGLMGRKKKINMVTWPIASRAKCWVANEDTVNESFEQFLLDSIWGGASWGTVTGPVRFHGDAGDDATYGTYGVMGMKDWKPSQIREHWTGHWVLTLPRLVEVPS